MAKRSCDRTTGVVLRGTESLLTHRWRGQSRANSSLDSMHSEQVLGDNTLVLAPQIAKNRDPVLVTPLVSSGKLFILEVFCEP
jgi:hypothetical protein